tara:strand:+ start:172 stop:393 length:222 start_codon:yes stop_codon:yes gene_type:complete
MRPQDTDEYKMTYSSTLLSLAQGMDIEILEYIRDEYENEEMYEACLAMTTAIEQYNSFDGFAKIKIPKNLDSN